jgi:hypothetical protein
MGSTTWKVCARGHSPAQKRPVTLTLQKVTSWWIDPTQLTMKCGTLYQHLWYAPTLWSKCLVHFTQPEPEVLWDAPFVRWHDLEERDSPTATSNKYRAGWHPGCPASSSEQTHCPLNKGIAARTPQSHTVPPAASRPASAGFQGCQTVHWWLWQQFQEFLSSYVGTKSLLGAQVLVLTKFWKITEKCYLNI